MKLHSLSISGNLIMNMHALNNEGSEGNTTMTRMVEIVDNQGRNHTVNAVSGDMFKHMQAQHLYMEAIAKNDTLPLCEGCKKFDANRICIDDSFTKRENFTKDTKDTKDSEILSEVIKTCVIDDIEGILITNDIGKKRSIGRKSAIEFGWVIGSPESTRTESYFHVKFVPDRGKGSGSGENLGQNIFHRPASSGQYAAVVNIDLYRVGRNDITVEYVKKINRKARLQALLKSVLHTFIKPTGAHRNTQHPHIIDFSGVISASLNTMPAPIISSLNPNYKDEIVKIADSLNSTETVKPITVYQFESMAGFTKTMAEIINSIEPYGD
ncbi:MAG TPA: DevR family CRISPR-associated autoregulator [Thermodesulfovibrionia bacterium]|nr:DevR family CRISPR-associated autoregulator [Thermodesulfovibrionia bacterium]